MTPPHTTAMSTAPSARSASTSAGDERLVSRRLRGDADHVHVVLDCLTRGLLRGLEERADVHVEAEIRKRGRNDPGAAVVPVLAKLDHQHARAAPFLAGERLDVGPDARESLVAFVRGAVDARDGRSHGPVACPDALERIGNLAHRRSRPCGGDGALQQIALAALGARTERIERFPPRRREALGTNALDPRDLRLAHGGVVDVQDVDIAGIVRHVSVDPDDDLLAAVHARLAPRRGLFDAQLRHPRRHRPGHAS